MTNAGIVAAKEVIKGRGIGGKAVIGRLKFGEIKQKNELMLESERAKRVLLRAAELARGELEEMKRRAEESVGDEHAEIFSVYLKILDGGVLLRTAERLTERAIETGEPQPIIHALTLAPEILANGDTSLLIHSKRTADVILGCVSIAEEEMNGDGSGIALTLEGENNREYSDRYILVCEDFEFEDAFEHGEILGVVCFEGALIAKRSEELGIPVICTEVLPDVVLDGKTAILDPISGRLTVNPDLAALDLFSARVKEQDAAQSRLAELVGKPSVTRSGKRFLVLALIREPFELQSVSDSDADGVILNTDFLLNGERYADEEKQFLIYRQIAESFSGCGAIRCFSLFFTGAEKKVISSFPTLPRVVEGGGSEKISLNLASSPREVMKTQIRACLRAAAYGNIGIIVPNIVCAEEARRVKTVINEAKNELKYECIPFGDDMSVGIEINTSAGAVMSDFLAREADFFIVDTDALGTVDIESFNKNATQNATQTKCKKASVDAALRLTEISMLHLSHERASRRRISPLNSLNLLNATQNTTHFCGKFGACGLITRKAETIEKLLSLGASFVILPPSYVLEARDIIRRSE